MEYREIFNHRGDAYHRAMELCPLAREEEFLHPLTLLDLQTGETVADFPSGGGYLRGFLQEDIEIIPLEASEDFAGRGHSCELASWHAIPLADKSVDGFLSLAALHHASKRERFYSEVFRALKPGGNFVIGDVCENSPQAEFLNGFVNKFNSMGHKGDFLVSEVESSRLREAGFEIASARVHEYRWNFINRKAMLDFCRGLFGLDLASDQEIWDGLLPIRRNERQLNWGLLFLKATSPFIESSGEKSRAQDDS